MKKILSLGLHVLSISAFDLGPAFPEKITQNEDVVKMVDGGRKKRKRKMRMILSSKERNMLDFLSGREKRKYVKELKRSKGVAVSEMEALIDQVIYDNLRKSHYERSVL
jgi:hypothetical protein